MKMNDILSFSEGEVMTEFSKADFVIDSIPGTVFSGYTQGDDWNGWACPYFEREEAERVLRLSQSNGFIWQYDEVNDAYIVTSGPAEDPVLETFEGLNIDLNGTQRKVYPVGAYSWIWETVDVE